MTPQVKNTNRVDTANDLYSSISMAVEAYRLQGANVTLPPEFTTPLNSSSSEGLPAISDINDLGAFDLSSYNIKKENFYNFDSVACWVDSNDTGEKIRITAQAQKELKQRHLSGALHRDQSQSRSVQQTYLTSADGYLTVSVIEIADYNVDRLLLENVNSRKDGGYDIWVALLPCNARKVGD